MKLVFFFIHYYKDFQKISYIKPYSLKEVKSQTILFSGKIKKEFTAIKQ